MANVLDYNLGVSKFELSSPYHVHFQTNYLGKGTKNIIPLIVHL